MENENIIMLGVCTNCGRTVYEGGAGALSPKLICKACKERMDREKEERERIARERYEKDAQAKRVSITRSRNRGLIWSAVITGIIFVISLVSAVKGKNWGGVGVAFACALFIYTFVAQLFWDGAVVACATAGVAIATPGVIFELSLDGFIFLIVAKLFFALLRILFFLLTSAVCILVAIIISPFTFVPALMRVNSGDLV